MRTVHHLVQGDPAWKAHRATPGIINGSEIAAIMGIDKYTSRAEMLRRKATGIEPEYDAATLQRFADGHAAEEAARPLAEDIIVDDISPLVMTDEIAGLLFSISLDGITQANDITFEHKRLNVMLADALDAGFIPPEYHPQMEAGLMVSGAKRCLFMASEDGNPDTARHFWYDSNPELRKRMISECKQFNEDVTNYQHTERVVAPVAATIEALPALFIQVEGRVVSGDMRSHRAAVTRWIAALPTKCVTDQDYANAAAAVKSCEKAENDLKALAQQVRGQITSVDEVLRLIEDAIKDVASARLRIDKTVKARKETQRIEIIRDAQDQYMAHIDKLNQRIGGDFMPRSVPMFAESIKGLKTLESMREKTGNALRDAMLQANELADRIEPNRRCIGAAYMHLFPDFPQVCTKLADDFSALLAMRIANEERRKQAEREEAEAKTTAAVAAAVEAERMAEAKRVADVAAAQAANDQRGKTASEAMAAHHDANDIDTIIHNFVGLLDITPLARRQLRLHLTAYERYRAARLMQDAAYPNDGLGRAPLRAAVQGETR